MNMKVSAIPLDAIDVGERLREVDPDYAALLAESFKVNGQRQPIEVRKKDANDRYLLIAGAHRLAAARLNGDKAILAVEKDVKQIEAELLEIDENLFRHDLTVLDRAIFLAKRKAIYLKLYPETAHGGDRRSDQRHKFVELNIPSFNEDTAKRLGVSDETIRKAIARFNKITPEVRRILSGTPFANKGIELDALASIAHDDEEERAELQRLAAEMLVKGTAKSAAEAKAVVTNTERPPARSGEDDFLEFRRRWKGTDRKRPYNADTKRQIIQYLVEEGLVRYPVNAD